MADLAVHLHFNAATDQRRYNLPTINEIAIILPSDDFQIVFDEFGQHAEDQSNALRLTQMDFYSFRLFSCHAEFSTILRDRKLFQEFLVDTWASTEQNRLRYLRNNQATLRADMYQGLADTIGSTTNEEINLANLGQRIILPSTHLESSRYISNTSQLQNTISLPKYMKVGPDIQSFIKAVYPNIEEENL
ncbi:26066_t:CDS:2, partial [Gigaspora rosea]